MLKSDALQANGEKASRARQRTSTSCTECRRRKQRCNQAKDRPCNNCSRRYPPVVCEYAGSSKSRCRESVAELAELEPKFEGEEEVEGDGRVPLAVDAFNPYGTAHLLLDMPLHGAHRPRHQSRTSSSSSGQVRAASPYSTSSTWEGPILGDRDSQAGTEHEECKSHMEVRSPYFPYPEDFQSSYSSTMRSYVGSSPLEPLHSLPVEATRRNAELMRMFVDRLSPYMSSIDGQDPSASFNKEFIPFMIQSPIIAYIGILTSSYFQAMARGIDVEKSVDAIATRVKLINLINEHLTTHTKGVTEEAIAAVMALAYNELIYADEKSVRAHMKGLQEMLRSRGGVESISLITLRKLLFRTDYQVACTLECDPFLDDQHESHRIPIFVMYPLQLDSPLLESCLRFIDSKSELQIAPETATILDDMRFLTTSVISMTKNELSSPQEKEKFLVTAKWIQKRLSAPSDPQLAHDFIYQSVHAAATPYSAAIISRTPMSLAYTTQDLRQLWKNMWRVPLSRWKQTPGIFFWVVLSVTPFAKDKHEGRFLKGMLAAATIAIGLVDWDVVMGMLRGFLAVQRWLRGGVGELKGLDTGAESPRTALRRKSNATV